ncbi:MAG: serpin family protein [Planctomycetaceae bacterium]|nr:serpin family protein [Planctomycetaceae bacterium]
MKKFLILFFFAFLILPNTAFSSDKEKRDTARQNALHPASFAFNWYQQSAKAAPDQNLVISPYGMYRLLGSLYLGSEGKTKKQFENVLGWTESKELWLENMKAAYQSLQREKDLELALGAWVQNKNPIRDSYVEMLRELGDAEVLNVDFARDETKDQIDAWGKKNSGGRITDIPLQISSDTKILLTDLIFFDAQWEDAFNKKLTRKGYFTSLDGTETRFPIMQRTGNYRLFSQKDWQWLEIPYLGKRFAMGIFLPNSLEKFSEMEKTISIELLNECRLNAKKTKVELRLPKFAFSNSNSPVPVLKKMGIQEAFQTSADFSGIADSNDIMLSEITQTLFLNVNEKGTEAVAVAAAEFIPKSGMNNIAAKFYADRPFVFAIYDLESDAILFCGRMVDPKAMESELKKIEFIDSIENASEAILSNSQDSENINTKGDGGEIQ